MLAIRYEHKKKIEWINKKNMIMPKYDFFLNSDVIPFEHFACYKQSTLKSTLGKQLWNYFDTFVPCKN